MVRLLGRWRHIARTIHPAGMVFPPTKNSRTFFRAFSMAYTISAFFFAQTYPTPPDRTDNPHACLNGNADHDRMSAGAAGAGWGVSPATSFIGSKARWCQLGFRTGAEWPERGKTDHAWVVSPHSQVPRRGALRREAEGLPNRDKNTEQGVWCCHTGVWQPHAPITDRTARPVS
jgi:hypothetical protein